MMNSIFGKFIFILFWNNQYALGISQEDDGLIRRERSEGSKTFRLTTIEEEPYLFVSKDKTLLGNDRFSGIIPDILAVLGQEIPMNYTLHVVADGKYGQQTLSDGKLDGMMNEIGTRKSDMAAAPISMTTSRARFVDFVYPIARSRYTILLMKDNNQGASNYKFNIFSPFSTTVWIMIVAAFIVVWLIMQSMNYCYPLDSKAKTTTSRLGIGDTFWFLFTLFNWQGYDQTPRSIASKILSCFWMCFVTIVLIIYTAGVIGYLNQVGKIPERAAESPIRSLDQLVTETDHGYTYGTTEELEEDFARSKIQIYERMHKYFIQNGSSNLVKTNQEGVEKVRNGKYALIMHEQFAEYYINRLPCDLMTVGSFGPLTSLAFALPIASALTATLDLALLQLSESGMLDKLEKKWFYSKGECPIQPNKVTTNSPPQIPYKVDIHSFKSALILLACGVALSALAAVFEILYYRRKGQNPRAEVNNSSSRTKPV